MINRIPSTICVAAGILALSACSSGDVPGTPGETAAGDGPVASARQAVESPERDRLRARLSASSLSLRLGVPAAERPGQNDLDLNRFRQALGDVTGQPVELPEPAGDKLFMKAGTQAIFLDPRTRYMNIVDSRGYVYETSRDVSDDQLARASRDLLQVMGIDPREAETEVVALGGESAAASGNGTTVERVGRKVFHFRKLGGIPVGSNRMVFSYALDGSLRHVRGTWPAIDYAGSYLESRLSIDEIVERALDAMLASQESTVSNTPVQIETFFEVADEFAPGTTTVKLRAAATTQASSESGPGRGVRYEFDI
jgi:hypothetical protein